MSKFKILIIDDQQTALELFEMYLENDDFEIIKASNPVQAIELVKDENIDLVVLDVDMPQMNGLEVLKKIKEICNIPVIMASDKSSRKNAIDAINLGAFYFIDKEYAKSELKIAVNIALKVRSLEFENEQYKDELDKLYKFDNIIGKSDAMQKVYKRIKKIVKNNYNVLIYGETGTGKELISKALHYNSNRKSKKFISVNVTEFPRELIASELFGHKKGSFTGAIADKKGIFEAANSGTVFLDEIGEMDLAVQAQLLRVLQEKKIRPIGSNDTVDVDVWILAATNKNLAEEVDKGNFREDLYQRLNVLSIKLPALADRVEDVPLLVDYFLKKEGHPNAIVSPEAMKRLVNHPYKGNVRELENIIKRVITFMTGEKIDEDDIEFDSLQRKGTLGKIIIPDEGIDLKGKMDEYEREILIKALKKANGVKKQASHLLKIEEHTFLNKVNKKYKIKPEEYK